MIKRVSFISMVIIIILVFFKISDQMPHHNDNSSGEYYIENALDEVGAKNIVTGIYLDYRYFDTIFEASILLVTVSGILFLSKFEQF